MNTGRATDTDAACIRLMNLQGLKGTDLKTLGNDTIQWESRCEVKKEGSGQQLTILKQ